MTGRDDGGTAPSSPVLRASRTGLTSPASNPRSTTASGGQPLMPPHFPAQNVPDDYYRLAILVRCKVGPHRLVPGEILRVPPDRLPLVAGLCRVKSARPADLRTELDVALYDLARQACDRRPPMELTA